MRLLRLYFAEGLALGSARIIAAVIYMNSAGGAAAGTIVVYAVFCVTANAVDDRLIVVFHISYPPLPCLVYPAVLAL